MKHRFTYCLVVCNTVSTNAQRALTLADQLNDCFPAQRIKPIEIADIDTEELESRLAEQVARAEQTVLVCVAGGDGTLNHIIETLLFSKQLADKLERLVVLPLWGGNSNDLAIMANGLPRKADVREILAEGKIVPVHPLQINFHAKRQATSRLAACYASIGMTALFSERVNHPRHRHQLSYRLAVVRHFIEVGIAFKIFVGAKPFTAELESRQTKLYDLIIVNGSRIAKRERFPIRLTEEKFVEASVERKISGFLFGVLHIINWKLTRPDKTSCSLTLHEPAFMQLDGETMQISRHTKVDIQLHSRPFYLLSTRLGM